MVFENLPKIFPHTIDGNLYGCPFPSESWVTYINRMIEKFNLYFREGRQVCGDKKKILVVCRNEEELKECSRIVPETKRYSFSFTLMEPSKGHYVDIVLYPAEMDEKWSVLL